VSPSDLKPYELMQKAALFFERLGVPYRIVGSMASMAYGEARFTNDIDILVDLREEQVQAIELEFRAPDFYVSIPAAREAILRRHQFNIIHLPSGLKIDLIQRKDTEFGRLDIEHGQRIKSEGYYDAWFGSPENVILMKLRYFQESNSEKHLRDIASILLVQGTAIDRSYIAEWADKLGVAAVWQLILERLDESADSTPQLP
jgi:hypothetical protein